MLAWSTAARAQQQEVAIEALAQILSAEDARVADAPALALASRNSDPIVRRHAALALGRIGNPSAANVLFDLLADPDSSVQASAAFALGLLHDPTAIPRLRLSVLDPPQGSAPAAQAEAVGAIARIGGPAGASVFTELLTRTAREATSAAVSPLVRRTLGESWRLDSIAPISRIAPFANSSDDGARWRAVYSIARLHGRGAPDVLVTASGDSLASIRAIAVREMGASFAAASHFDPKALATRVRHLTADADPLVRIAALRALASYHDSSLAAAAAERAADRDPNVRVTALATLGDLRGSEARATLEAYAQDGPFAIRRQALLSLSIASPVSALRLARIFLAESDWRLRVAAAEALSQVGTDSAIDLLVTMLGSSDGRITAAAYAALGTADSMRATTLAPQLLHHGDPVVRGLAASRIGPRADPGDLPALLDAYAQSLIDSIADARIAIVAAAGQIAAHNPAGPAATALAFAKRFPGSSDYLARRAAAENFPALGGKWGPEFPYATGLGIGDYRDIARRLLWPAEHDGLRPGIVIETDRGSIGVTLFAEEAPIAVKAFLRLIERRFFDGRTWHRVVPGFVAQDGDPRGDGAGGPGYALRDEISPRTYEPGTVGIALDGRDTGGSQFFITLAAQPHLDGIYPVLGRVDSGMDVLAQMVQGDRIRRIRRR